MKRKILIFLTVICMTFALAFGFTSCLQATSNSSSASSFEQPSEGASSSSESSENVENSESSESDVEEDSGSSEDTASSESSENVENSESSESDVEEDSGSSEDTASSESSENNENSESSEGDVEEDSGSSDVHVHTYIESVTAPTCLEQGCTTYRCDCGDYYIINYVSALGCNNQVLEGKAPTCTTTGLTEGKTACSRCSQGAVAQQTIPALGCDNQVLEGKAPTCTTTGLTEGKTACSRCGQGAVAQQTIPALGCNNQVLEGKAPTCTTTGLTEGKTACSRCSQGAVAQQTIPALGCDNQVLEEKAPTCTTTGLTEGKTACSRCGQGAVAQQTIPALGCDNQVLEEKAPTCTGTGLTEGKTACSRCGQGAVAQQTISALGCDNQTLAGKVPTCTTTGLTEGKTACSRCGQGAVAQQTIPALGCNNQVLEEKAPTCTATGLTEGKTACSRCSQGAVAQQTIPALGCDNQVLEGKAPTCTTTGLTEGKTACSRCGQGAVAQQTIPALGCDNQVLEGKAPTCTTTGLTEGKTACSRCGQGAVAQQTIPALGCDNQVLEKKVPTCTATGLTEGKTACSRCGQGAVAQQTISALGCDYQVLEGKAPTCTGTGLTEGKTACSRCGQGAVAQQTIPALGCDNQVLEEKAPTCTTTGLTEGKTACSRCGQGAVAQQTISALGCDNQVLEEKAPTCTTTGLTEGKTACSRCGQGAIAQQTIPALGCDNQVLEEKAPTCTTTGLTEGKTACSRCGQGAVAQEEIPALGHSFTNYVYNNDATCMENGTETAVCDRCDATDTREKADSALGHNFINYVYNNNATDTQDGTETGRCERCDATDTRTKHSFTNYVYNNDATCMQNGTETAICDRCDATDTREKTYSKLNHLFGTVTYTWSADFSQCTATRVCVRDASHIETETVNGVYVKDANATSTSLEKGHYEATFSKSAFAKVAHTIGGKILSKEISVGVYADFSNDVAELVLWDNNKDVVSNLKKKVVEIAYGDSVKTSVEGFKQFAFKSPGVYQIKVEAKDRSGNTLYTVYTITASDTTKPFISASSLVYTWVENGKIAVPEIIVKDISNVTVTQIATHNGVQLPISDGQVSAQVGDEIVVTYTATDESGNVAQREILVKVLEKGKLIDGTDTQLDKVFTAEKGILRGTGEGLSLLSGGHDTLSWKEGAYSFGSVENFAGIAFEIVNNKYLSVNGLLNAIVDGEKICVGGFTVSPKNQTGACQTFIIDLSKSGLNNVEGWSLDFVSNDGINLLVKDAYFTQFSSSYVTIDAKTSYKKGEAFRYTLTINGEEIRDTVITVSKNGETLTTLSASENYVFSQAGEYLVSFSVNVGNKVFTQTKNVTVTSNGYTITLNGQFVGGKINQEYTIPITASDVSVEVLDPNGQNVEISSGKFTPTTAGRYVVRYYVSQTEINAYTVYVEGENELGFEGADAFNFSETYNGGFEAVKDDAYASAGVVSAKATVGAGARVGATFAQPYALNGPVNYVTFNVQANHDGEFKIGFIADGYNLAGEAVQKAYESDLITLKKGENEVKILLDGVIALQIIDAGNEAGWFDSWFDSLFPSSSSSGLSSEEDPTMSDIQWDEMNGAVTFTGANLYGLYVKNVSSYDNIYHIDDIRFSLKTSVSETDVFNAEENVTLYGEENGVVLIPDVIACDKKFLLNVSVKILHQNGDVRINVGQPDRAVKLTFVKDGNYIVRYEVTTFDGTVYIKDLPLIVMDEALKGRIPLADYYVGVAFTLPEPIIESEVYTTTQLKEKTIRKYYKLPDGLDWIETNGELCFLDNTQVDVKYVVEMPSGENVVLYAQTYIHDNGVHLDFEQWSGGEHMGIFYEGASTSVELSKDWSHTGKYSVKCLDYKYNTVGTINFYDLSNGRLELNMEANAIVFWAYAPANSEKEVYFSISYKNAQKKTETYEFKFHVKKGVNKYVLPFNSEKAESFNHCTSLAWYIPKNLLWYFDSFSFVRLGDVEYDQLTGEEYISNIGVTIQKPTITNLSNVAFTQEDVKNAKYSVSYYKDGVKLTKFFPNNKDEVTVYPSKGEQLITVSCEIAGVVFKQSQTIVVHDFSCEFTAPRETFFVGQTYQILMPTTTVENVVMSANYRKVGESDWIELVVEGDYARINFGDSGDYELMLKATSGGVSVEKIFDCFVRDTDVFADFEKEEDGTHFGAGTMSEEMVISTDWSRGGKYSLKLTTRYSDSVNYLQYLDGSGRPTNLNGNYIGVTMWIKADKEIADRWIIVNDGTTDLRSNLVTLKAGEHMYLFTFDRSFSDIRKLVFRVTGSGSDVYYVDQIKFVNLQVDSLTLPDEVAKDTTLVIEPLTATINSEGKNVYLEYKFEGETSYRTATLNGDGDFAIPILTEGEMEIRVMVAVDDEGSICVDTKTLTVYNFTCTFTTPRETMTAGESYQVALPVPERTTEAQVVKSAQYRKIGANNWIDLPILDDYATVQISEAGNYELKLKASLDEAYDEEIYDLFVRGADVFADFELEDDGTYFGTGTMSEEMVISDAWAYDGDYSLKLTTRYSDSVNYLQYCAYGTSVPLNGTYNAISMWIKTDKQIADRWINVEYDGKQLRSNLVTLQAGEHMYLFTFDSSFSDIQKLVFRVTGAGSQPYYVDQIKFVNLQVDSLIVPEQAIKDTTLVIEPITAKINDEIKTVCIEYKFAGETSYRTATLNGDGNIAIPILTEGEMEVRVLVSLNGMDSVCVETHTILVETFACTFTTPKRALNIGQSCQIALPVPLCEEEGIVRSAQYRMVGMSNWIDLPILGDYATVQISEAGNYELKLKASLGEAYDEEIFDLLIRSADVFADFELEDDGTHFGAGTMSEEMVISDTWAYDGDYSLKLTTRYSDSVNYLQYTDASGAPISLGGTYNAITMRIKADKDISGRWIQVEYGKKQLRSATVDLKKGENEYTFTFSESFDQVYKLVFRVTGHGADVYYVDQIKFGN